MMLRRGCDTAAAGADWIEFSEAGLPPDDGAVSGVLSFCFDSVHWFNALENSGVNALVLGTSEFTGKAFDGDAMTVTPS